MSSMCSIDPHRFKEVDTWVSPKMLDTVDTSPVKNDKSPTWHFNIF